MQAKDVIDRARIILQDAGADYWQQDELPKWLTDGRMEAYSLRPSLYQTEVILNLVDGAKQLVPSGSKKLFDVIRNVSHPRQRRITLAVDDELSRSRPAWRGGTKAAEIIHYLYSDLRGDQFETYPPARAGTKVEISYAALPIPITTYNSTTELSQEGELAPALVDYVLYRAFLKEADTVPAFHARAAQHYSAFRLVLAGEQPAAQQ